MYTMWQSFLKMKIAQSVKSLSLTNKFRGTDVHFGLKTKLVDSERFYICEIKFFIGENE